MSIVFDLWLEGFDGRLERFGSFSDYEEAQYEGMSALNTYREARNWHVTVQGQKPHASNEPIPGSLERWTEFNERIPA